MVQNRPILDIVSHLVLIIGILIVALPIWITFVAATHDPLRICLLYTSPSPRDQRGSRMPSSA